MPNKTPPSLEEQKSYYDKRWPSESKRPNRLELIRLVEILKSLADTGINPAETDLRICDLGCGRGWISSHLAQFGHVTGVDLSEEGVRRARAAWPNVTFMQGDITKFRTDIKFDVVVSSEVLEHVPDHSAFFNTVRDILRPGGHLIVTTPNKKLFNTYSSSDAEMQPVEHWLSLAEMREIAGNDFSLIRHQSFLFDYYYSGIFRVISAPKLISACRFLRLEWLRMRLNSAFQLGLHQIYHARLIR